MRQPTIQLAKDNEVWYELDERWFDGAASELKDRSGNRVTASASGGPTVGVNGIAGFDATSFDGDDDEFNFGVSGSDSFVHEPEFTIFIVFKNVGQTGGVWGTYDDGYGQRVRMSDTSIDFEMRISDATSRSESIPSHDEKYHHLIVRYKEQSDEKSILTVADRDNESIDIENDDDSKYRGNSLGTSPTLGASRTGNDHGESDIAMFGYWTRYLNETEVDFLHSLSAPRRMIV